MDENETDAGYAKSALINADGGIWNTEKEYAGLKLIPDIVTIGQYYFIVRE